MSKIFYKVYTPNFDKSQNDLTSYKSDESVLLSSFDRDGKLIVQDILNKSTSEKEIRGLYFHPDLKMIGLIRVPQNGNIDNYKDYLKLFNLNISNEIQNILKEPNNIISNEITRIIIESSPIPDLSTKANTDASNIILKNYKDKLGLNVYTFGNELKFNPMESNFLLNSEPYAPGNNLIIFENDYKKISELDNFKKTYTEPINDFFYDKESQSFLKYNGSEFIKLLTLQDLNKYATLEDLANVSKQINNNQAGQVFNFKGDIENSQALPSDSQKGDAYINKEHGSLLLVTKPLGTPVTDSIVEIPIGNIYNNINADLTDYLKSDIYNTFSRETKQKFDDLVIEIEKLKLKKDVDLTDYVKKSDVQNLIQNVTFNNDYIKVINPQGELEPARIIYGEFTDKAITLRIKEELQKDIQNNVNTFIFIDVATNITHIMKKDELQFV